MLDNRSILGRLNNTLVELYEMIQHWKMDDYSPLDCPEYKAMDDTVIDKMLASVKANQKLTKLS